MAASTPHYSHTIDQDYKPTYQAWLVVLTAALFFFYEFVQMSMFNAISPELMAAFGINGAQFGNLSATYFYADVLFLLPAGIILDRVSTRKLIVAAMLLCIICTYIFAFAESLTIAMIAHGLTGVGSAFCLLSCLKLASRWFPPRRMALITGLVVTMAMLGGIVAQTPFAMLAKAIGWRHAVMANATLGIVLLMLIYNIVRDYPEGYKERFKFQDTALRAIGFWCSVGRAVRNLQVWLAGLYTSLINLPIFLLGQTWGTLYLLQVHHMTRAQAGNIPAMLFLGTIIGSPVFGWVSDRIGLRRVPMFVGGVLSLLTILLIVYVPILTYGMLLLLFLLLGFFTASQVIGYPVVVESSSRILTASSMGMASVLIMLGGTTEPIFGWLLDLHWNGHIVDGVRIFSRSDFHLAMLMMPIAFIAALGCTLLLRETHCKMKDE